MKEQRQSVITFVKEQRAQGQTATATLAQRGITRSTYYAWLKPKVSKERKTVTALTPDEQQAIEKVKEEFPLLRHRQLQGILQIRGLYLSPSSVYGHLKAIEKVEPYERRPSPLKEPRYSVRQRNLMWGADWTRLTITHVRWYLLIIIDFFSRYIIRYGIFPSVNSGHVGRLYREGLVQQALTKQFLLPELRVDRASPNTSGLTKDFFATLGAELSFARVRRPTDNAITERFFGTAKQEEVYLVGSYPDERSAWEEIGRYITHYNTERPHLWNFTPAFVHEMNNKTTLLQHLAQLKEQTRSRRKAYWEAQTVSDEIHNRTH